AETCGGKCPIVVKIAPDWEDAALTDALETIAASGVDGLNATNTTISRDAIAGQPHADEAGGLSGAPLLEPANRVLKRCREVLGDSFPIMGSGGIMSGSDAVAKVAAGADVVQLYTGFIYNGPDLVHDCARAICQEYAHVE
ncbi:MAG: quinone-dependent dihydroorotate dehydrogenase, partial [Wenzhouxiangellaceae bacterium]